MGKILAAVAGMFLFACLGCGRDTSRPGMPDATGPIKHVFLAVDESRQQLLCINQFDPSKDWVIAGRFRDIQLIGGNKVLLSTEEGYREYSLESRNLVKEVKGFAGVVSARRMADGKTLLTCNNDGVTVRELDADGKEIRHANFKTGQTRLIRYTPQGTFMFGTFYSDNKVVEGDIEGRTVRTFAIPGSKGTYLALRKPDGHLLLANGYDAEILEVDSNFKTLRTLGGKQSPDAAAMGFFFFAGTQVLKNGDIVVSNWTGHGAADSEKGTQIVQFNPAGKVVWKWHDAKRAGSIHAVIVLDELDTNVLNDDISSVLGPVGGH